VQPPLCLEEDLIFLKILYLIGNWPGLTFLERIVELSEQEIEGEPAKNSLVRSAEHANGVVIDQKATFQNFSFNLKLKDVHFLCHI
jgi:hypothetical protein